MKKKVIIFFMLFPFFCSCLSQQKKDVEIEQVESTYSVILGRVPSGKRIHYIDIPLKFKIKKNIPEELFLETSSYLYKGVCEEEKGHIRDTSPSTPLTMPIRGRDVNLDYSYKEFVYMPGHTSDTTQRTQALLKPYLDKMNALGKDSLHIGTIEQLKKTNPELLKGFLGGDSICIEYRNRDKRRTHRIFLPVEIK